jgi:hypothetical protein
MVIALRCESPVWMTVYVRENDASKYPFEKNNEIVSKWLNMLMPKESW